MAKQAQELPRGIRQRGEMFHIDVSWKGVRKTATAASLTEAKRLRETILDELKSPHFNGEGTAGKPWTVERTLQAAWRDRWSRSRSAEKMKLMIPEIEKRFGKTTTIDRIGLSDLKDWVFDLLEAGNSPATVNRKLSALSVAMKNACEDRANALVDVPKMPRQREEAGRIRYFTDEEEAEALRILDRWQQEELRDWMIVQLDTGMRVGESLNARPADYTPAVRDETGKVTKRGTLAVWVTKTNKPRIITLTNRANEVLEKRCNRDTNAPFFGLDYGTIRLVWARLKKAMGLRDDKDFVPHVMRHTFATRLAQARVPVRTIQRLLGHTTHHMTMRYIQMVPDEVDNSAAEALEREAA